MKWKILVFLLILSYELMATDGDDGESKDNPVPGDGATSFHEIANSDWFAVLLGTAIVQGK